MNTTKDALPDLPKHLAEIDQSDDEPTFAALTDHAWDSDYARDLKLGAPLFTAGQMRDYALAALASKQAPTEQCDQHHVGKPCGAMDCYVIVGRASRPAEAQAKSEQAASDRDALYLLQDTRSYVGNCPMWWAKDGNGYTTRIDLAHRYTLEAAMRQHRSRDTDLPWLLAEIEPLGRLTVDVQDMHKLRDFKAQRAAIAATQGETKA